ncbi:motility protein A [Fonticella tunisiensis]|uniref:Chemotaxis protein MotA n=1 Tax=Fonticella tunisiensis TaxID=1096341 RepID=A0A4R7K9A6_9CLOT|nr:motility protein A [Fonticella tunisiensis]TDT50603.1 chemotaxis protein MotA [Fonticella tunisiensis]
MNKKDFSTVVGIVLGAVAIILGMTFSNGKLNFSGLRLFWDPPSIFITVFGSFFTLFIAYPLSTLKKLPATLKNAFLEKQASASEIIERFTLLSKKARREGLLSLEDQIESIEDEFLRNGIQMVVDGIEPETIREILELEISEMEKRHQNGIAVLKTWANLAPAYGMIGTLIGLIQMLAQLQDQSKLGPAMAVSLITSFYGAVMANFIFTPLANKLEDKSAQEADRREMMLEGILAIQSGVNPRIVGDKLRTYLSPAERLKMSYESTSGKVVTGNE